MSYIVGLSGLLIDGATCVVGPDGRVVAAVEEERPSRLKHASMRSSGGLPYRSIESCLKIAGIGWKDVSQVGYFFQPWREFRRMTAFRLGASMWSPTVAAYYSAYQLEILPAISPYRGFWRNRTVTGRNSHAGTTI